MSLLVDLLQSLLTVAYWIVACLLILWVGYLMLLTACAWVGWLRYALGRLASLGAKGEREALGSNTNFLIMIPAHNEEVLLPELLHNLFQLDYPNKRYAIHVVADNCTDQTAELARAQGAIVYERFDMENVGKGCALEWLLHQVADQSFDAALILDADSIVSTSFLQVMDSHLNQGATAIQAYYAVRDAETSWATSLRAAALAVLHYLRPQGRMVLGVSAGLKGNGMVFARSILERHQWSTSVTEDIEYHMSLVLAGEQVAFAPEATVWAEIPTGLQESDSQNTRWEQGRLAMAKKYVPQLLSLSFSREVSAAKRFVLFDAAMEHLIPPFSIVLALNGLALLLAIFTQSMVALVLGIILLVGQALYLVSGMVLVKTPLKAYLSMLYLPLFLSWKIWLYIRVLLNPQKQGWIRTTRVGER